MPHHPLVDLARDTIENYIKRDRMIEPPEQLTEEMRAKAGVFVSIHKHGDLRGCIGTFSPTTENVAREVIRNAIAASTQDPRFSPIEEEELAHLEISVDVLSSPQRISSTKDLDARKFGVIVESGFRKGLLLPDLPGVNTPEEQIAICRRKAGISDSEPVTLYRFEVKRFH